MKASLTRVGIRRCGSFCLLLTVLTGCVDSPVAPTPELAPAYSVTSTEYRITAEYLGAVSPMAINDVGQIILVDGSIFLIRSDGFPDIVLQKPAGYGGGATAINNAGVAVGSVSIGGATSTVRATMWTNGLPVQLGSGPWYPHAINDNNVVLGTDPAQSLVIWADGNLTVYPNHSAHGINNRNQIVGSRWESGATFIHRGFLLEDGIFHDLGDFRPTDINDSGHMVGYVGSRLVLWQDGLLSDVALPAGAGAAASNEINDFGIVLGTIGFDSVDPYGYQYFISGPLGVKVLSPLAGSNLTEVRSLSNKGIVGTSSTVVCEGDNYWDRRCWTENSRATRWTVAVHALTPSEQTSEIATTLGTALAGGEIGAREAQTLTDKLQAANLMLERSNQQAAANLMEAFANQVDAFVRAGKLSAATGAGLAADARAVAEHIRG